MESTFKYGKEKYSYFRVDCIEDERGKGRGMVHSIRLTVGRGTFHETGGVRIVGGSACLRYCMICALS